MFTAALRALEDQEGEGALFSDPLAGLLAGRDAVRQAEAYAQVLALEGGCQSFRVFTV